MVATNRISVFGAYAFGRIRDGVVIRWLVLSWSGAFLRMIVTTVFR
jgi:hypothetical protein